MSRWSFVGRRLLQVIPVLIGVTLVSFFILRLVPGDPTSVMLGEHYTPEAAAALRESLGLNQSIWAQYGQFMVGLLHGDLGTSIYYQVSVGELITQRLPVTLWLAVEATLLSIIISVPLATLSALRRNGIADQTVRGFFTFTYSMPPFWVGLMLILGLALKLPIFPVAGFGDNPIQHVYYLFLPSLTIAIGFSTILIRTIRNSILDALKSDYVDVAWAKGLSWSRTLTKHVLRNALMPGVAIIGVNLAMLIGGTVIIENVFALPGMGQLLISAVHGRDLPVVQGAVLVFGLMIVFVNILTDVAYTVLDPRVTSRR